MKWRNGKCQNSSTSSVRRSIFILLLLPGARPALPPSYLGPQASLGVGPLLRAAVRGAGPLQGLLARQAARALRVHVERLIRAEYGLEDVVVGGE